MRKIVTILLAITMILSISMIVSAGEEADGPKVNIVFANSNMENTAIGQQLNAFMDYIEEKTGGNVTFTRFFGGSVCSDKEEYSYLSSGAFDMGAPKPADFTTENPYLYGITSNEGWDEVYAEWKYIFFENEETSSIIKKYTDRDGLVVLGVACPGMGCLIGNEDFNALTDLEGRKIGVVFGGDFFADVIKAVTVSTSPAEMYDSLSRGVYDYVGFALSAYVPMSLNEVAPFVMNSADYATACTVMIRDEVWNQLSEEQQQIFYEACDYLWQIGADASDDINAGVEAACEEVGGRYWVLDDESASEASSYMSLLTNVMLLNNAETLDGEEGRADEMTLIVAEAEANGLNMVPEE